MPAVNSARTNQKIVVLSIQCKRCNLLCHPMKEENENKRDKSVANGAIQQLCDFD